MKKVFMSLALASVLCACGSGEKSSKKEIMKNDEFQWNVDKFDDIEVIRYRVDGFESLSLKQKELIYYLSEAALYGRDILFDQFNKYNLAIRRSLEAIYTGYQGDKNSADFKALEIYLKKIWFANGIHHHYSKDKFTAGFSKEFFTEQMNKVDDRVFALKDGQTKADYIAELSKVIFDANVYPKGCNQAAGEDLVLTSAVNFYDGVNQSEVEEYYNKLKNPQDTKPVSYGLNSRVVKEDGKVTEKVWKVGGMYTAALEKIVFYLDKAKSVAETPEQKEVIEKLIKFYQTGDLKDFDDYAVSWVYDLKSQVDFVNGFTETYGDPLGMKGTWESVVNFKNIEATKRTEVISANAQWFEDNSPVDKKYKKDVVKGVSAKVINVAMLGGDCYPASPLGINLPNSNWIRAEHGSKSVTIDNISAAYNNASKASGFGAEFIYGKENQEMMKKYGDKADNIHTDLHECLGHGSGKLLPGVDADALKAYGSPLEEARADLFALYYVADAKLVELGIMPDKDAYKAEYYTYLMNGLMTQLTRIQPGKSIEQAHMRNRSTIAHWVLENGRKDNVVELRKENGKTYVVINDYEKLRGLFAQLLAIVQEIKSTGNYEAAKELIETYGVKVDPELHKEVLTRYKSLNIAPYKGLINPVMKAEFDEAGNIKDVKLSYEENYVEQMLRYSKDYSVLPTFN